MSCKVECAPAGPLDDRLVALVQGRRRAIALLAQGEQQMPRHQIVAELVGQADDLRQAQRVEGQERLVIRRGRLDAHLAVELSAQLPPQLDERAERIVRSPEQHAYDAALRALRGQRAAEHDAIPLIGCNFEIDPVGGGAAAPGGEADAIFDDQIERGGCRHDLDPVRVPAFGAILKSMD